MFIQLFIFNFFLYFKEFNCKECGQKFLEKAYLEWHEKKHSSKREVFECEYCKKKFYYKGNLKEHIKYFFQNFSS